MPLDVPNPRTPDDDSLIKGGNWLSSQIVSFICRVTPSCPEMTRLLSKEMDHALPRFTRLKMRVHFLTCCYCRRYMEHLRCIRKLFRSLDSNLSNVSSARMSPEAKDRIARTLRDHLH
jgi:hypothetical protein